MNTYYSYIDTNQIKLSNEYIYLNKNINDLKILTI